MKKTQKYLEQPQPHIVLYHHHHQDCLFSLPSSMEPISLVVLE